MKWLTLSMLYLFLCWIPLSAQVLRCKYSFKYKTSLSQEGSIGTDSSLCVESDGGTFLCYSENMFFRDSLRNHLLDDGYDIYSVQEQIRQYSTGINWFIVGQPSAGTFSMYSRIATLHIKGSGHYENPVWKLTGKLTEICGYLCTEASGEFLGRKWTIYFAEDIPLNVGPWLLWGAPGLILMATDSEGLFSFTCLEVGNTTHFRKPDLEKEYTHLLEESSHPYYYDLSFPEMDILHTKLMRNPTLVEEMAGVLRAYVMDADGRLVEDALPSRQFIPLIPDNYWK